MEIIENKLVPGFIGFPQGRNWRLAVPKEAPEKKYQEPALRSIKQVGGLVIRCREAGSQNGNSG
jgi:hypothetical protein